MQPVSTNSPFTSVTSRAMNTLSQGTSTSSNTATQSISSIRVENGWSPGRPPVSVSDGRQMKRTPGVATGMQKANAYGRASSEFCRYVDGNTAISLANGASVATERAPLITIPASVSFLIEAATPGG